MDDTAARSKRRGSRRAQLSRETILAAALELMDQGGLEAFSLNRLAVKLGAGVMSLYTYFPSRDALLAATAETIFARFEAPAPRDRWQDAIQDWLWATVRHLDRHPIALQLGIWEGRASPLWLHVWLPIAARLRREGLDGRDLGFAMHWFSSAAMGFIAAQLSAPARAAEGALAQIGKLGGEEQRLAAALWLDLDGFDRDTALAFGFWQIIKGLETLIAARVRDPQARTAAHDDSLRS